MTIQAASISDAVAMFLDFAAVTPREIERAIEGDEFDASEVLASFQGVAREEIEGEETDGTECDWSGV